MPFTPIHLGPGALFKAIGGRHFSFMVFGGSQVMMDIEPLVGIIQGKAILHGYTHTLAGALLIGVAAGLIGRPISAWVLRGLRIPHFPLTWTASFAGALVGTFSHVLLDAVMHSDMNPWRPIAEGNGLLAVLPVGILHMLCLGLGIVGAAILVFRSRVHGKL